MKTHTQAFKNEIKEYGRQFNDIITYTNTSNNRVTLDESDINKIQLSYDSNILKSQMKKLVIDSKVELIKDDVINYQIGLLVNNSYEYLNMGDYIVTKIEQQKDTKSYLITCYDKMLLAMQDYESLGVTYSITIRDYISALCTKLGLTFHNASDTFTNYDKEITSEHYLDVDGNSLGYTYRDVLDDLAEVVGGFIVINSSNELEIKYIENTALLGTIYGNTTQASTPTPSSPQDVNVVTGNNTINILGKNLLPTSASAWEQGTIASATGQNSSSTTRIRTIDYYEIQNDIDYYILVQNTSYSYVNIMLYDTNKTYLGNYQSSVESISGSTSKKINIPSTSLANVTYMRVVIQKGGSTITASEVEILKPMIVLYEQYTNNSYSLNLGATELCKIGDYQDSIFKSSGKNLFDYSDTSSVNSGWTSSSDGWLTLDYDNSSGTATAYRNYFTNIMNLQPNKTYTFVIEVQQISNCWLTLNQSRNTEQFTSITANNSVGVHVQRVTTRSDFSTVTFGVRMYAGMNAGKYGKAKVRISVVDDDTITSSNFVYEPYGTDWYIKKNIKKLVFDGSESLTTLTVYGKTFYNYIDSDLLISNSGENDSLLYSNYYLGYKSNELVSTNGADYGVCRRKNYHNLLFRNKDMTSLSDWVTWLSTHNTIVYFPLANPTYTKITDTTLLEQLNTLRMATSYGKDTNILVSGSGANLTIDSNNFVNDYIDEEYFKDKNVNIKEKYGPINSLVTNIGTPRQDASSITQNGLCEIQILDNPILDQANGDGFLDNLFNRIKGTEYYLNDFQTNGILYYEIGDKYNVSIDNNIYSCLMLNDEITRTTGLKENIYTNEPKVNEPSYKYENSLERTSRNAYIIANKSEGRIDQIVTAVGDNGQVTSASIVQAINDDTSSITLNADKIKLEGYTTINGGFAIDSNGTATITNGDLILTDNGTSGNPSVSIDSEISGGNYYQLNQYSSGANYRYLNTNTNVEAHGNYDSMGWYVSTHTFNQLGDGNFIRGDTSMSGAEIQVGTQTNNQLVTGTTIAEDGITIKNNSNTTFEVEGSTGNTTINGDLFNNSLDLFQDTSGNDWQAMLKNKIDYCIANMNTSKTNAQFFINGGWAGVNYGFGVFSKIGHWYQLVWFCNEGIYHCCYDSSNSNYGYNRYGTWTSSEVNINANMKFQSTYITTINLDDIGSWNNAYSQEVALHNPTGGTVINAPGTDEVAILKCYCWSGNGDWAVQEWFGINTFRKFIRVRQNSVWTGWRQLT